MTVQERQCPRCSIRRTLRYGGASSFCANCRLQWDAAPASASSRVQAWPAPRLAAYPFTPRELDRLGIYRAAVRAGLYTDWP